MGFLRHKESKDSSFSEEKEAKRLFPFACRLARVQAGKSFLVLFFKKEHACFLAFGGSSQARIPPPRLRA
jgi:hypothetical protein